LGIFAAGAVLIALQATSFSNLLERGLTKMLVFLEVIALSYSSIFSVFLKWYILCNQIDVKQSCRRSFKKKRCETSIRKII